MNVDTRVKYDVTVNLSIEEATLIVHELGTVFAEFSKLKLLGLIPNITELNNQLLLSAHNARER